MARVDSPRANPKSSDTSGRPTAVKARAGDSLAKIAAAHGVAVAALKEWNPQLARADENEKRGSEPFALLLPGDVVKLAAPPTSAGAPAGGPPEQGAATAESAATGAATAAGAATDATPTADAGAASEPKPTGPDSFVREAAASTASGPSSASVQEAAAERSRGPSGLAIASYAVGSTSGTVNGAFVGAQYLGAKAAVLKAQGQPVKLAELAKAPNGATSTKAFVQNAVKDPKALVAGAKQMLPGVSVPAGANLKSPSGAVKAVKDVAANLADDAAVKATATVSNARSLTKLDAVVSGASKAVANNSDDLAAVALKGAGRVAASTLGKTILRLMPAVNAGAAVLDGLEARRIQNDEQAPWYKKAVAWGVFACSSAGTMPVLGIVPAIIGSGLAITRDMIPNNS